MAARPVAAARGTERAARSERASTPGEMGPKLGSVPERPVRMVVVSMVHFFFHFLCLSRFNGPSIGAVTSMRYILKI